MTLKVYRTRQHAARKVIDRVLRDAGQVVPLNGKMNFSGGPGLAVRKWQTGTENAVQVPSAGKTPDIGH